MPKVSKVTFCVIQNTLPLSKSLLCGLLMCFVWQPPSNSLFVAVTDYRYTTILFWFYASQLLQISTSTQVWWKGEYTLTTSSSPKRRVGHRWYKHYEIDTDILFVPMPTHCTIRGFRFSARRIDGVECGLFANHAPLGQTTLRVGWVSV